MLLKVKESSQVKCESSRATKEKEQVLKCSFLSDVVLIMFLLETRYTTTYCLQTLLHFNFLNLTKHSRNNLQTSFNRQITPVSRHDCPKLFIRYEFYKLYLY